MKKSLSILMIAIIAVSSAFAMTGYIGASSGYSFDFVTKPDFTNVGTHIPVSVDGAAMFGKDKFNFGLSYGAEIASIPMTYKIGDVSFDADPANYEWTLAPYAGLAFQYRFGDSFGLMGTINATYN